MKTEKTLQLKQSVISYSSEGNGFPMVFVHGFPMDHTAWDDFVKPLAEKYRVILPDNAGFGKSSLPPEDLTMDYYADCIKAILDEEKARECLMIGHSMGGYIVLNFAKRFPASLKGFGLLNSTAYADDDAKKQNRIEVAATARKGDAVSFVNAMLHKLFGEKYSSSHEQDIVSMKNHFGSAATTEGIAQASLAMGKREDTSSVLINTKVPVLFIIGKEDKVIPPEKILPLTHLPERSVIGMPEEAGHMVMIEASEESKRLTFEWIEICDLTRPDLRAL